jgi:hypothetical protein
METITSTYINKTEITARHLQPFCIDGARNPVPKFASHFTKHVLDKFKTLMEVIVYGIV